MIHKMYGYIKYKYVPCVRPAVAAICLRVREMNILSSLRSGNYTRTRACNIGNSYNHAIITDEDNLQMCILVRFNNNQTGWREREREIQCYLDMDIRLNRVIKKPKITL